MSDAKAVELVREALKANGIEIPISVKPGTWTEPSILQYEINGKKHVNQFWNGNKEMKVAGAIFREIMTEIDPEKLAYLRSKDFALAID